MFTLQEQFENCMRLSIGLPFSEEVEHKLKQLGRMVRSMQ
jgi:DNA-binding transcriptional MocR family regulator